MRDRVVLSSLFAITLTIGWAGCTVTEHVDDDDGNTGAGGATATTAPAVVTGAGPSSSMSTTGPVTSSTTGPASSSSGGSGAILCNPVTNALCNTANGEACDANNGGGFSCFPDGNVGSVCDSCNNTNGPWCKPGHTCGAVENVCARYCCTDADCGDGMCTGKGNWSQTPDLGFCTGGNGGGAGGAGGAGGGSPVDPNAPACSPSKLGEEPSMGSCVTVM